MPDHRPTDPLTRGLLALGLLVPVLYYGAQAAAAPFFPDFSVVSVTASELGSDRSRRPAVLNTGIMALGGMTILASVGFLLALRRLGVHLLLSVPTTSAVFMSEVQTLWAGYYPLPDPRHGGHPAFVVFMLALPPLLTAVAWRQTRSPWVRGYFAATLLLLACMVPVMTRMLPVDTHAYRGVIQRVFALAVFPPVAVAAYVLLRRLSERATARAAV